MRILNNVFTQVQKIAKELDITPAQVLISWAVQRGVRRSSSQSHLRLLRTRLCPDYRPPEERHPKSGGRESAKYVHICASCTSLALTLIPCIVTALPTDLFNELEAAAAAHPPQRVVNPSKGWGLDFDIFDD